MVLALLVFLLRDGRHDVDPQTIEAPRASPAAAAAALASFVDGVRSRDAAVLAGLAPPQSPVARDLMEGIGHNADALDLRGLSARFVDQAGMVEADGSWTGIVELTWQLGSLDPGPSEADVAVSFAPAGDALGIVGFSATARARAPLWLRGELAIARAKRVLVLVDGPQADADAVRRRVVRGIGVVERVLPDRISSVVVEVPANAADLDETLGAEPGTYAGIAAVTAFAGTSTSDDAPVHVFVNPELTTGLSRAGAQVVMSHELVHIATEATRTPVEPWLLEGFADYVALRDTNLPDSTTLGRAIELVRREGIPDTLPGAADFGTRARDLQASYELAWLACRLIAEQLGERGLVSVHDAIRSGAPVAEAMVRAGLSLRELTPLWRAHMDQLTR
ncbi:hypothetical protein ACFQW6_08385 [Nocardioides sp. GCM10028917]|uniref:hypothetical protein n=1 Tax=Nocardioides sp. GCM10028917 TaxID=3273408 RepID=UPI003605C4A8